MPEGNTSQRNRRNQVNVTQAGQTTEVTARYVNTAVAPNTQASELLKALDAAQPIADEMTRKMREKESQQAEAERLGMSQEQAQGYVNSEEFKKRDIAYRRSFMLQHGKMDGRAYRDSLVNGFDTDYNPDNEDINAFKKRYAPTPRSQDADYLAGYNHYAGEGVNAVESAHQKYRTAKAQEDMQNAAYQDALEFITDAAGQGRVINPQELQILKENNEVLGLTKKQTEELLLKATDSLAFNGYPELYDIFYEKRTDGSPGLAHTAEYGEEIAKKRAQALHTRNAAAAKADEQTKFNSRMYLHDLAEKGMLTRNEAKKHIDILSAATVAEFVNRSDKRAQEIADFEAMKLDIRKGNGLVHKDDKDYKKGVDDVSKEILSSAGQDPIKQSTAISQVVDLGIKSGQLYSPWENTLKNTNPLNAPQFTQSAFLYRNIQAANPAYAAKLLPESQRVLFDTYQMALDNQSTPEQALAIAQRIGTTESETAANAFLQGQAGRELISSIDSELDIDESNNQPYVRNAVKEKVVLRIRLGMSPEQAKESAIKDFEATHMMIDGRYVMIGRNPLIVGQEDIAETYLKDYAQRKLDAGEAVDPEGYHIMHDLRTLTDGTYGVYSNTTGFPDGRRLNFEGMLKYNSKKEAERLKQKALDDQQTRMQQTIEHDSNPFNDSP